MITYKEFVDKMIEKGYVYKNNGPIEIDESSPEKIELIKQLTVEKLGDKFI